MGVGGRVGGEGCIVPCKATDLDAAGFFTKFVESLNSMTYVSALCGVNPTVHDQKQSYPQKKQQQKKKKACILITLCFVFPQEFDIDPEADGDQVDELLSMCVRQAVQS